ncbi:MAG: methyltransferase [Candidatus Eremiobacteraeota bacterium]|nr:methyltransferase [Candidatus Eremiobacteraeota bacterium]
MACVRLSAPRQPEQLTRLPGLFESLGYSEADLRELLRIPDVWDLRPHKLGTYIWRCQRERSVRGFLTALFLLGRTIPRGGMERFVPPEVIDTLVETSVLGEIDGKLTANVDLYPCEGRLLATDPYMTLENEPGHVYKLGADSYTLAHMTPRRPVGRTLNVCAGSGLHAVLASSHSQEVVGLDINSRALEFCRLNAAMNGCWNCSFTLSDLYSKAPPGGYDLVLANPPFVPSPHPKEMAHRSPGVTGEEVSEQLVAELPKVLAPGGTFAMVLDYPIYNDAGYLERVWGWLGQTHGWGLGLVHLATVGVVPYIEQHIDYHNSWEKTQQNFDSYLSSYQSQGIVAMGFGVVFIRRFKRPNPGFKQLKLATTPVGPIGELVGNWLDGLEKAFDPNWSPDPSWKPQLSSLYSKVWRDRQGQGKLEPSEPGWVMPLPLDPKQTDFLWRVDGETSVADLFRDWPGGEVEANIILRHLLGYEVLS